MTKVCLVLRYVADDGHGPRSMSMSETIEAHTVDDVALAAQGLLSGCPDDRSFVTHHVESGAAFRGYRKMQTYFYGPGLAG